VKYIQAFLQIFFDGEPKDITSYNQKHWVIEVPNAVMQNNSN
jgi:hypothetical protein